MIASTIHLHTLLFSHDRDLKAIRTLLEQNFVMMSQFRKYWPSLQNSFSRLTSIHAACEAGYGKRSFQLDHWMLAYLHSYDMGVDSRFASKPNTPLVQQDMSELPWSDLASDSLEWLELQGALSFD